MIGTIANTGAILMGSLAGSFLRKGFQEKYQAILYEAMGLAATGLGIHTIVTNMSKSHYPVLFIASLAIGGLFGTALDLDNKFQILIHKYSKSNLGQGLSTAIMLFCIGSLSILGPIESALHHNETFLFTNATLDLVTSFVLASTYGIGISFAALVLFLWQSGIYLFAHQLSAFLTTNSMTEISIVGGFLILASGLSILNIKKFQTLNLLPALAVPAAWFALLHFIG